MNPRTGFAQFLALPLILAASALFAADRPALRPGKYVSTGGSLTIERAGDGKTTFELLVVSPWNGHTCGPMDGEIRNRRAVVVEAAEDDGKPAGCAVTFSPQGDDVNVTSTGDACSDQCGAAVKFEGLYVALPAECDAPALSKTRQQFKRAYDAKDYGAALHILQPVHDRCAALLESSDEASMRNDLAITQYHLHDATGCLRTLEPLREEAEKTDATLETSYPAFALETRLPGIRATRTNLKLCRSAGAASPAR